MGSRLLSDLGITHVKLFGYGMKLKRWDGLFQTLQPFIPDLPPDDVLVPGIPRPLSRMVRSYNLTTNILYTLIHQSSYISLYIVKWTNHFILLILSL